MNKKNNKFNKNSVEKMTSDLSKSIENQDFESEKDVKEYLDSIMKNGKLPEDLQGDTDPQGLAQDIIFDAWEEESQKKRITMAKKALSIFPDCADAYNLLAEDESRTIEEAKDLYQKGMEAGRRGLGEEIFKENTGNFWLYTPTRPYMCSCAGFMECLWGLGECNDAIGNARKMLKLNPGDNQGIRYILASYLAALQHYDELDELLNKGEYKGDCSADWLYSQALLSYVRNGNSEKTNKKVEIALESNKFAPEYLTGKKPIPSLLPERITAGGEDEGFCYAASNLEAWQKAPGAIEWLKETAGIKIIPKVKRNEPCPCGSGKKYKKCCLNNESENPTKQTDSVFDKYLNILEKISIFAHLTSHADRERIFSATKYFNKNFKIGEENGMPNNIFINWLYFDFRFGKEQKTICEKFIESEYFEQLTDKDKILVWQLAASYNAFYEVAEVTKTAIIFKELCSGKIFHGRKVDQPFEKNVQKGEIWYERFLGTCEEAYMYTPPFVYPNEMESKLIAMIKEQKDIFIRETKTNFHKDDIFRESFKQMLPTWMSLFLDIPFNQSWYDKVKGAR